MKLNRKTIKDNILLMLNRLSYVHKSIIRQDMKNLLILIVASALFLHFYPQPELEKWYNHHKNSLLSGFHRATDTQVRINTKKVLSDLEPLFTHFSPEEIEYSTKLTVDRETLLLFHAKHCDKNAPDFNFQSKNQKKVCTVINKYSNYF